MPGRYRSRGRLLFCLAWPHHTLGREDGSRFLPCAQTVLIVKGLQCCCAITDKAASISVRHLLASELLLRLRTSAKHKGVKHKHTRLLLFGQCFGVDTRLLLSFFFCVFVLFVFRKRATHACVCAFTIGDLFVMLFPT